MAKAPKPPKGYATIGIGESSNAVLTPAPRIAANIYTPSIPIRKHRGRKDQGVQSGNIHTLMPSPADLALFSSDVLPPNIIADLFFENIGGQEILTVARHDTVNGRPVIYQPIKNIAKIAIAFNSLNIVPVDNPSNKIFSNFKIRFQDRIPVVGSGPNGEYIYLDGLGNVIIDVVNLGEGETVQVDVISEAKIFNDTVY